ncbi:MAG: N-acetyltransferase [Nakamurella sp.]
MTVLIRPQTAADHDAVQALIGAAFGKPRAARRRVPEVVLNEALHADPAFAPELTLVAELDRMIVGQVTSSYGVLVNPDPAVADRRLLAVGPVSVLPTHQHTGIGSIIMRRLVAAADAADEPAIVLLGSPDFYGRFGFVEASEIAIEAPDPSWGKYFQARRLTAYDRGLVGRYRYAKPFAKL